MPQIETWPRLPAAIREHLVERMRDRNINLPDLNQLRLWMETKPEVPEGLWYKDFGSFKKEAVTKNIVGQNVGIQIRYPYNLTQAFFLFSLLLRSNKFVAVREIELIARSL